jgi:hypothetical protein
MAINNVILAKIKIHESYTQTLAKVTLNHLICEFFFGCDPVKKILVLTSECIVWSGKRGRRDLGHMSAKNLLGLPEDIVRGSGQRGPVERLT